MKCPCWPQNIVKSVAKRAQFLSTSINSSVFLMKMNHKTLTAMDSCRKLIWARAVLENTVGQLPQVVSSIASVETKVWFSTATRALSNP